MGNVYSLLGCVLVGSVYSWVRGVLVGSVYSWVRGVLVGSVYSWVGVSWWAVCIHGWGCLGGQCVFMGRGVLIGGVCLDGRGVQFVLVSFITCESVVM